MKNLLGPGGEGPPKPDSADSSQTRETNDSGQRRRETRILTVEDCMRGISQLPGLIAMEFLTPAKANAIRASYREVLQYHHGSQVRENRNGLATGDVVEMARKHPEILELLEPLLTDEQIAILMKDSGEQEGE